MPPGGAEQELAALREVQVILGDCAAMHQPSAHFGVGLGLNAQRAGGWREKKRAHKGEQQGERGGGKAGHVLHAGPLTGQQATCLWC